MTDNITTLPPRSEIAPETTWDLKSIFPADEAWKQAFADIQPRLEDLESYQGRLAESPETLLRWFTESAEVAEEVGKLYIYASLSYAVDTNDQDASALYSRATTLYARFQAAVSFAEPELAAIAPETLRDWTESHPGLALYEHYFDRLEKRRPHLRSQEVEKVLAQVGDPFSTATATYGVLSNADLEFEPARDSEGNEFEVAQGTIIALMKAADREVRRTAYENYNAGYLKFKNTYANLLSTSIKQDVFRARARGYDTALEAALGPESIPTEVFHNLIEVFKANLPTWHRYWRVRREALGYDRLHVYDIWAPIASEKPGVPFERAIEWIGESLEPLGEDYVDRLRQGVLQDRWVDIYPNKGKRQGAFSSGVQGTYPFILMSYVDDLFSLSTLAHELGHSMHSYLTWETQPYVYSDYSLFVAEVASNFHQAMVRDRLFETQTDPNFQIALIEEAMANFHRYFFIMPTLARFELETHTRVENGEALTADSMIEMMDDLFREGYGEEMAEDPDRIGITWARFGHLYVAYYVYQYATGISGAHALAQNILTGEPGAVERYLEFLRAGGSRFPLDALREAGVDLASPDPVEKAFGVLADLVDRLEELVS